MSFEFLSNHRALQSPKIEDKVFDLNRMLTSRCSRELSLRKVNRHQRTD